MMKKTQKKSSKPAAKKRNSSVMRRIFKKEHPKEKPKKKLITSYSLSANGYPSDVRIETREDEFVPIYSISEKKISKPTCLILQKVKEKLIKDVPVVERGITDISVIENQKKKFQEEVEKEIALAIPNIDKKDIRFLSGYLMNNTIGLGIIEVFLADENLEEVAVNGASEPIWLYHRNYGWLKSNVVLDDEELIENYASLIGRKVGKRITTLTPLMDAHLLSGNRVNASLFPISTSGNTLTIRKFREKPITITDLLKSKSISVEILAMLWQAIQYETSLLVSGGTASGKTTFLSALMSFTPPNQRLISIEDTREIKLPKFLHWVPMTTREPSSEGTGEISMLDLVVNSLRMRPDRIMVGEIRRQREAEVLFEALRTGHSVYATLHADTAIQTIERMTNPPINLPPSVLSALPLIVVMYRQRRIGIRRMIELAEIVSERGESRSNTVYKWSPRDDEIVKVGDSIRLMEELKLHTGMTKEEIGNDIAKKAKILTWIYKNNVCELDQIGSIISQYYLDPAKILKMAKENHDPFNLFGGI